MSGAKKILHVTVVTERQTSKKSFEVDSVIVGRNPDCLLPISHHDVSRRHVSLWIRDEDVWIEDLGSSNGTFVNGARLIAHSPQILFPTDKVSVGATTGIGLSVRLEVVDSVAPPPEEPAGRDKDPSEHAETVIFAPPPETEPPPPEPVFEAPSFPSFESAPSPSVAPAPAFSAPAPVAPLRPKSPSQQIEINRLLQEAKREAEEIVRMARLEAEHKVQEIYERAESTQKEAEDFYHRRMQEAYRRAEEAHAEAKAEAENLLEKTRKACDEIRRQTNASTAEIRSRTRKECDVLLREAEAQARLMKEQRQQEAEAVLLRKEEQLIGEIKESMALSQKELQDRLAEESRLHEERLLRERTAHEDRLARELSAHQEKIRSESETHADGIAKESDGHRRRLEDEAAAHESRLRSETEKQADERRREKERFETETAGLRAEHASLTEETTALSGQKKELEEKVRKGREENEGLSRAREELSAKKKELERGLEALEKEKAGTASDLERKKRAFEELSRQCKDLLAKKESASREVESELLQLKTKLETAKAKMKKEEEEQLVYLKLETAKRVQRTEKELLSEIARKKDAFVREILVSLEKSSALISGKISDWRKETPALEENLLSLIDGQLFAMKVEGVAAPQKIDLSARRRRERAHHVGFGAVIGMLVLFIGFQAVKYLKGPSPLERAVASEAEARKKDLENRKFDPAKSAAWKENYVDAVVYTDRFVEITTSDDYQKKWSLAASKHLLKLWKVDEDSSLRVVSIANALVKSLAERKEKIHPDYVKDGLRKMKEAEDEAVRRMSNLLGSQVRFESLKKFEKEFFLAYRDSRSP